MKNFLAMLDKLAQRPALTDARLRVFKLEANPEPPQNLARPQRLPLESSPSVQPGRPAFGRKRRPKA